MRSELPLDTSMTPARPRGAVRYDISSHFHSRTASTGGVYPSCRTWPEAACAPESASTGMAYMRSRLALSTTSSRLDAPLRAPAPPLAEGSVTLRKPRLISLVLGLLQSKFLYLFGLFETETLELYFRIEVRVRVLQLLFRQLPISLQSLCGVVV